MGIFFETLWLDAVLAVITLCVLIYHVWTLKYNYWKDRNVPYLKPSFPFGNTKDLILFKKFLGDFYKEVYFELEGHKFGGIISLRKPQLVLRDPDIIKLILTKDFNHFTDRGIPFNEKVDPLSAHLFNLSGEKWRILRSKLTPTFTSGKMKMMFHLMKSCAKILEGSLLEFAERGAVIEVKDFMARFGTDVIGACAFGLETESIKNPDNEFRRISKEVFKPRPSVIIRGILNSVIPGISRLISIKTTPKDREDFFFKIVHDTVEYREKNNVVRNDFLDLLIQIRNKGQLDDDTIDKTETSEQILDHKSSNDIDMTNELMTAQCFVFFLAGFETSSSALSFCLYELALNKVIQEKLQKEVDDVLAKYNGEVSYEALKEMIYMDRVIQETLRKYPPAVSLIRECVADYTIKEENLKIEKGMRVIVPLFAIHYDPVYYPEPERFDPDRFTEQAKQSRPHYAFLPFGEGPRICIGLRFGLLEIKTALTALLSKYNFDCTPETLIPMEFNKKTFLTTPKEEIKLKISKRSK